MRVHSSSFPAMRTKLLLAIQFVALTFLAGREETSAQVIDDVGKKKTNNDYDVVFLVSDRDYHSNVIAR